MRQAQQGEPVTITVAGRPTAVLRGVSPGRWRRWEDLADLFTGLPDRR